MSKEFWFIRHGEALKNLHDIHGGAGTSLTKAGRESLIQFGSKVSSIIKTQRNLIVGHNVGQVRETCDILDGYLDAELLYDERIKGIGLGVASGLSREEVMRRYPHDARLLEGWRAGTVRINELDVTGMESIEEFGGRILAFLDFAKTLEKYDCSFVICTTSVAIYIINLVLMNGRINYGTYRNHAVKTCDYIRFSVNQSNYNLLNSSIKELGVPDVAESFNMD